MFVTGQREVQHLCRRLQQAFSGKAPLPSAKEHEPAGMPNRHKSTSPAGLAVTLGLCLLDWKGLSAPLNFSLMHPCCHLCVKSSLTYICAGWYPEAHHAYCCHQTEALNGHIGLRCCSRLEVAFHKHQHFCISKFHLAVCPALATPSRTQALLPCSHVLACVQVL